MIYYIYNIYINKKIYKYNGLVSLLYLEYSAGAINVFTSATVILGVRF